MAVSTLALASPTDQILVVTLDRPESSNAFNTQMARDLITVFEDIALHPNKHRIVVLTGRGDKAFCAGGDLKERNGMSDSDWQQQHLVFERMIRAALDFVYAVEHARFAQTETRIGIIPGIGGTQNLARAIGERRAKEFIFSGKSFTAMQAQQWGLVNAVFPTVESLQDSALEIALKIAANAPVAVRQAKQAVHRGLQMSLSDGMAFEIEAYKKEYLRLMKSVIRFSRASNPTVKATINKCLYKVDRWLR